MEATLEDLSSAIETLKAPAKATGLVSGSTQTGVTTGGGTVYKVQSTVGNYMSGIEQEAKDSGGTTTYKVYSSVQGAIVSN
ncbi:MAG: hypothetical protein J7501_09400 [Bdellovibrio sp.]|nr:hypothetical protein [Bdellovibrio sp.]